MLFASQSKSSDLADNLQGLTCKQDHEKFVCQFYDRKVMKNQVFSSVCGISCIFQAREGHLVDALALRGDEGRDTLRKATGSCE